MCTDHPIVQRLVGRIEDRRIITYGEDPQADVRLAGLDHADGRSRFSVVFRDRWGDTLHEIEALSLPMPGRHNALNATAAVAVAHELGIADELIAKALAGFGGVKRRFTRTGDWNGVAGLGSNLIVRDGGVPGVVIRLGRGFNDVAAEAGHRVRAGAAVPDVRVARVAQEAGIAGLAFLRGVPGAVGGALRMNGGAYGSETKDVLIEARGVDRAGHIRVFANADMGYTYRHCDVPEDVIFTQALFQGGSGDPGEIAAEMDRITEAREATQPVKSRTGGSTFKNPPGYKAWQLIDAAGCRGLKVGDAQVSELHCNFLINLGNATAADIETLGETVRARVKENFRRRTRMGDQTNRDFEDRVTRDVLVGRPSWSPASLRQFHPLS